MITPVYRGDDVMAFPSPGFRLFACADHGKSGGIVKTVLHPGLRRDIAQADGKLPDTQ
ncbi:UNVERIFIED_ORG: hypothetical protein LHK14_08265 [Roseateles sp. XES5]|nr:hypothetical protein [Roseateles sp. XES5]